MLVVVIPVEVVEECRLPSLPFPAVEVVVVLVEVVMVVVLVEVVMVMAVVKVGLL